MKKKIEKVSVREIPEGMKTDPIMKVWYSNIKVKKGVDILRQL